MVPDAPGGWNGTSLSYLQGISYKPKRIQSIFLTWEVSRSLITNMISTFILGGPGARGGRRSCHLQEFFFEPKKNRSIE